MNFRRKQCEAWTVQTLVVVFACALTTFAAGAPRVFQVDCEAPARSATQSGDTTLHSLAEVNALTLQPGDQVAFRRGSLCRGVLSPKGSGTASASIRITSYGTGPRPRIEASQKDEAAIDLRGQSYWEIDSLDITGSQAYGIRVLAEHGLVRHLILRDLTVHAVGNAGSKVSSKESGLVVVHATSPGAGFEDVLIDGIYAYDTSQWAGIIVSGSEGSLTTRNVIVRNSTVHDVQGDGIVLFQLDDGLIENSVAWHTGMQETETIGTPNAIWAWACNRCTVRNNEAFLTDSPGVDGGAFDIDYWNRDNAVLDNYAHDTQGYCVSVFGAFSPPTTASVIRGNLCIRNGLSPRLAQRQGAIFLATWRDGSIDGVQIERNTIYFDPPGDYAAIRAGAELRARNVAFDGNVIDATSVRVVSPGLQAAFEHGQNRVTHEGPGSIANPVAAGDSAPSWAIALAAAGKTGTWRLVAAIPATMGDGLPRAAAGALTLLRSQALQYSRESLQVIVACRCNAGQRAALEADWRLADAGITLVELADDSPQPGAVALLTPDLHLAGSWHGSLTPVGLGLALRASLGTPRFAGLPAAQLSESVHVPQP